MYGQEYKLNTWQSVCTSWDGKTGLVQLWLDGRPSSKKYCSDGTLSGRTLIMLGQVALSIFFNVFNVKYFVRTIRKLIHGEILFHFPL